MALFNVGYENTSIHKTHCTHFKGDFIVTLLGSLIKLEKLQKPKLISACENGGYSYIIRDNKKFVFRQVPEGLHIMQVNGENEGKMLLLHRPCPEMIAAMENPAILCSAKLPVEVPTSNVAMVTPKIFKRSSSPA